MSKHGYACKLCPVDPNGFLPFVVVKSYVVGQLINWLILLGTQMFTMIYSAHYFNTLSVGSHIVGLSHDTYLEIKLISFKYLSNLWLQEIGGVWQKCRFSSRAQIFREQAKEIQNWLKDCCSLGDGCGLS